MTNLVKAIQLAASFVASTEPAVTLNAAQALDADQNWFAVTGRRGGFARRYIVNIAETTTIECVRPLDPDAMLDYGKKMLAA